MGGIEIQKAEEIEGGNIMADRRLYRTADGRIVESGDADARFLLAAGAGDLIGPDVVKAFRLQIKDGKVVQAEPDPDQPSGQLSDAEIDALAVGLKVAAEKERKEGLGRGQTQVAVTEPPPVDEQAAARARARKESDQKPVPETATAPVKVAAPKAGKGKNK